MKLELFLGVVSVLITLGQTLMCYHSLEYNVKTSKTEISCENGCETAMASTASCQRKLSPSVSLGNSKSQDLHILITYQALMKVLLSIGVVLLSLALGQAGRCYFAVESKYMNTARFEIPCGSQCGKSSAVLPDGSEMIVRACAETFNDMSSPDVLNSLPAQQRLNLQGVHFGEVHMCSRDLCNGAPSALSASLLSLIIGIIVAIITIN
ncbi:uncharacterized protein LOC135166700 isoform X2 [Diachasmimorpha longicaudata]|uniref:uncharacterized protein LOC135166700 isoform X2 n=1 Tax=Diachasmimorpha longicaudata TaxID=58733 RepID=UPI0030B90DEB